MIRACGLARVLVRFRPLGPAERPDCCVQHPSSIAVQHTSTDGTTLGFSFDAVLGQGASQAQVPQHACCCSRRGHWCTYLLLEYLIHLPHVIFAWQVFEQVADVVRSTLEGKNGTIMAYGQTGASAAHACAMT